ncbi:hypothetical protein CMO90_01695 [Candidatus Woesearchaeota archaeon]|jgi:hypothetical protein|nr:hypothetical protein [Candidatus Woesearchaeota archaeon]|tara:strand:- start:340 stop:795 length:456 start_codon:yes stop_codon:yes gene_type:complete
MDIWVHFTVSALITVVLWPFFGPISMLVLIGGVLIDVDHYFWNIIRNKNYSLKKTYQFCKRIERIKDTERYKEAVMIFHTFDALIIMILISLLFKEFYFILLGVVVHLFMDFMQVYVRWGSPYFLAIFKKSSTIFLIRFFQAKVISSKPYS